MVVDGWECLVCGVVGVLAVAGVVVGAVAVVVAVVVAVAVAGLWLWLWLWPWL